MADRPSHSRRRRTILKVSGGIIAGGSLAGCLGGGGGDGGDGGGGGGGGGDGGGDGGSTSGDPGGEPDTLEARAKEEGELNVRTSGTLEQFPEQFQEDTGISISHNNVEDKTGVTKLISQHQSGNISWDMYGLTNVNSAVDVLDRGVFQKPQDQELIDMTYWHGPDNTMGERGGGLDLSWQMGPNVPKEERPTTWDELVSGDYSLTIDTQEFEYVIMWEDMFDTQRAKEMITEWKEVSTLMESHSSAEQAAVQGRFDGGVFKYYAIYEKGQRDLYQLTELQDVSPIIVVPQYLGIVEGANNPNAAEYFFKYYLENFTDYINQQYEPLTARRPKMAPKEIRELTGESMYILGYEELREGVKEAQEKWQQWVVEG